MAPSWGWRGRLIFLEPLSQRAHWLWLMGVGRHHLDHLGVGVPPPRLASAGMLIERRDRLLSAGSPRLDQRPVGASLGHWWVMPYVCVYL